MILARRSSLRGASPWPASTRSARCWRCSLRPHRRRRVVHGIPGAELHRRRRGDGPRRPGASGHELEAAAAARARRLPRQAWMGRERRVRRQARSRDDAWRRAGTRRHADVHRVRRPDVPGPLLEIGNTTSRVDFGCDPGIWTDAWSASGVGHHWALAVGHRAADFRAAADLLGIDFRQV